MAGLPDRVAQTAREAKCRSEREDEREATVGIHAVLTSLYRIYHVTSRSQKVAITDRVRQGPRTMEPAAWEEWFRAANMMKKLTSEDDIADAAQRASDMLLRTVEERHKRRIVDIIEEAEVRAMNPSRAKAMEAMNQLYTILVDTAIEARGYNRMGDGKGKGKGAYYGSGGLGYGKGYSKGSDGKGKG